MQQASGKFQKNLHHLVILAGFIIISCLFCLPAFQGNIVKQHDSTSWLYVSKESRDYYAKTGENALWANNMFAGMPQALVDYHPQTNWYGEIAYFFRFTPEGHPTNPAVYFIFAMVSFYILALVLRVNPWLGAAGAIAFAFSSYNPIIIAVGHITKMLDIAYLPGVLAGILLAYRGRYWSGAALAGVFLAFFFTAGHYQIIYYTAILVFIMVIGQLVIAVRKKTVKNWVKASVLLALSAIFALAASGSRTIQSIEYNEYSIRGGHSELDKHPANEDAGLDKDYAFQWSNGPGEILCLLVPDLYGGASTEDIGTDSHFGEKLASLNVPPQYIEQMTSNAPMYWGPQTFIAGPVYFGAVICFLTVLSFLVIRSRFKWWLGAAALFFILLSLGKHFATFNFFLFDHLPMLNRFRTPSMALALPSVIFPIMAIWGLRDIFRDKIDRGALVKNIKIALYITGGICLLILIGTQLFMDFKGASDAQISQRYAQIFQDPQIGQQLLQSLRKDRAAAAASDAFRSLIFIVLAAGILWAYEKQQLKKGMAIAGMLLLIGIDEVPVAHRYLNKSNYEDTYAWEQLFQPRPADIEIMKDTTTYFRVLDLTANPFTDGRASYFHKSLGGYHPAKLEIYQDLIENQLSDLNSAVLNMLNTKYLIVPGAQGTAQVQLNPDALGNAWFVRDIKWAATAREAMNSLNAPSLKAPFDSSAGNFQPLVTAVMRDSLKTEFANYAFGKDSSAYIRLTEYGPRRLTYESYNSQPGLGVFSEIYYPIGWEATIDGKPAPIYRVDYVLRALKIPPGKHTIHFEFNPRSYTIGERIGLIGSILLTLLILAALFVAYRKNRQPQPPEKSS